MYNWTGEGILVSRFPNLFALDKKKYCFISDRLSLHGVSWDWKMMSCLPMELLDLTTLCELLNGFSLSSSPVLGFLSFQGMANFMLATF